MDPAAPRPGLREAAARAEIRQRLFGRATAPHKVGRYELRRELGHGGMGVVFEAHDPVLGRAVAIKLVRHVGADEGALRAVVREGRALARVSHPNVAQVLDVGLGVGLGGMPAFFIVMELVRGPTLRAWLDRGARSVEEILAVFAAAGRGLAAAHGEGVVHSDFKPANVIVADEPKVLDFGIARFLREHVPVPITVTERSAPADETSPFGTGIAGTLPYMAPEQLAGERPDPASDQFSFCVALYEGLHGERPFRGRTVASLRRNIARGPPRRPPSRIPRALHDVVARGLAEDPADRFESMTALVHALGRSTGRRPVMRRTGLVAVALVSAASVATVVFARRGRPDTCEAAGAAAQDASEAALNTVAAALAGQPRADATLDSLSRYAEVLAAAESEACAARRGQTDGRLQLRRERCLAHRRHAFRAVTSVLADGDDGVRDRADRLARGLPEIDTCRDVEALRAATEPPRDAAQRALADAAQADAVTAEVLHRAGRYKEGLALARRARADAEAAGYAPVLALALHREGALAAAAGELPVAEAVLERAYLVASGCGADDVAQRAAAELVAILGRDPARTHEAWTWVEHANAALDRARLRGTVSHALLLARTAFIHEERDELDRAIELHRESLALTEHLFEPRSPEVANALTNLGIALDLQGHHADALELLQRAREIRVALDPTHPDVAQSLHNITVALNYLGRHEEARKSAAEALEVWEATVGDQHPRYAATLVAIGNASVRLGRLDEALKTYRRVDDIYRATYGDGHVARGGVLSNVAAVLEAQGEYERELEVLYQVLDIQIAARGEDASAVVDVRSAIGSCLGRLGRFDEAIPVLRAAAERGVEAFGTARNKPARLHLSLMATLQRAGRPQEALTAGQEALRLAVAAQGEQHQDVARITRGLGRCLRDLERFDDATAMYRRSMELHETAEMRAYELPSLQLEVSQHLWGHRPSRAEARRLARAARDALSTVRGDPEDTRAKVDAWLVEIE